MWRCVLVFLLGACCSGQIEQVAWDTFSTKTLYRWAHSETTPEINAEYNEVLNGRLCEAVHVGMVVRHGARYPSDGSMEEISDIHARIKNAKSPVLYPELDNWQSPYSIALENTLNPEGERELRTLGQRTKRRFSRLFTNYGKWVSFISSNKQRTTASANSFYQGLYNATGDCLFGGDPCEPPTGISNYAPFELRFNNSVIRYYDGCERYEKDIEDNPAHMAQFAKYSQTEEFINIAKSIRTKLGLPGNFTLSDGKSRGTTCILRLTGNMKLLLGILIL